MPSKDIYLGPNWKLQPPVARLPAGDYTAADQARGWGVPEEQLKPEPSADGVAQEPAEHVE